MHSWLDSYNMQKELDSNTRLKHYAGKSPRIQARDCHAKGRSLLLCCRSSSTSRSRSRSTKILRYQEGSPACARPVHLCKGLDACDGTATTPIRRATQVRNVAFLSSSNVADDNESTKAGSSSASASEAFSTPQKRPAPKPKSKAEQVEKDKAGHFCWRPGMLLDSRYEVKDLLGDGTFGRVLQAKDLKNNRKVSVKVIRNVERYQRNAKHEAGMLRHIRESDPNRTSRCLHFYDSFFHDTEDGARLICLVCEVLGMSLHDLMKQNQYRGFWVQDIQSISMQCLQALNFMHTELSLTHTDLKIENILFVSTEPPQEWGFLREASWQEGRERIGMPPVSQQSPYLRPACTKVKLIDFGNATYERETHPKVINTRQYRAPEVFMDLGWNERSDLWAVGCTIMELYTGSLLFRTQESLEHLALIEQTVAKFPERMLQKTKTTQQERFVLEEEEDSSSCPSSSSSHIRLRWPEGATSAASVNRVKQQRGLQKLIEKKHRAVAEFAASLLAVDPSQRPSAQRALEHPFFGERFLD